MQSLLSQIKKNYPSQHIRVTYPTITPDVIRFVTSHVDDDDSYAHGQSLPNYIKSSKHYAIWSLANITLHVLCPSTEAPPNQLIRRVIRRVVCITQMFNIQKPLTFWLLPTLALRTFPSAEHVIDTHHINGGFTYINKGLIFIFRKEEFPKVMLHETLHHSSIDTSDKWKSHDLMILYRYFQIDQKGCPLHCETDLVPNEAIVETWAELFQIAFLSHEYGFPWQKLLETEKDWACKQAKRVLQHQKDNFPLWKEKSHAYSYVVFRAALLHNLHTFFKYPSSKDWSQLFIESFESNAFQKALQRCNLPKTGCFRMCIFSDL